MKIEGLHVDIFIEPKDYFIVTADDDKLKVILSCGDRRPVNVRYLSRRQAHNLIVGLQKVMLLQDEAQANEVVGEGLHTENEDFAYVDV